MTGLGLVTLLAVILRAVRLGSRDYWHDEVHNLLKAEQLHDVIFEGDLVSNHPPLYTILVWSWRHVGLDYSEWTMRTLPLVLGVCGVIAIYFLGRLLFDHRSALMGAFLLAISPFHVLHSQDLKVYILLPFTCVLTVYFLYRAASTNRPIHWTLYGLSAGVACYSDLFAGPFLVAINLWFLLQLGRRPHYLPRWCMANAAGAILFLPQLSIMVHKANNIMIQADNWWVPRPSLVGAAFYFKTIAFGYSHSDPAFKIAMALFALLTIAGVAAVWSKSRRAVLLLVMWSIIPTMIVYIISMFTQSIFLIRAMLPYAMPVYLLVGLGVTSISRTVLRRAAILALVLLSSLSLVHRYTDYYSPTNFPHRPGIHPPRDYRAVTEYILDQWRDGDVVVHTSATTWQPCFWYGLREYPSHFGGIKQAFIDDINQGNPRNTLRKDFDGYFPKKVQPIVKGKERVWLIFAEWERIYLQAEEHRPGSATEVWRWFDSHAVEIDHKVLQGIELFLYDYRDGHPQRIYRRDHDDGVFANLVLEENPADIYTKFMPDNYLVESPPEARRGKLTLRFDDEHGKAIQLAEGEETKTVSFALENRSDEVMEARVEVILSTALVDAASLFKPDFSLEQWQFTGFYAKGPPRIENNFVIAEARLLGPGNYDLQGTIQLQPGTYVPLVYRRGSDSNSKIPRASLSIHVEGKELLQSNARGLWESAGWNWFVASLLQVESNEQSIEVTAHHLEGVSESRTDIAYIVFQPATKLNTAMIEGSVYRAQPGQVKLPPKSISRWTATVDATEKRIDILVATAGPDGEAHRIFQVWTP